ncbi:dynein axonemal assembly factor 8 [Petaurus breviceps papuanus]|uniref:dynein axonemal assembly factor 8 n=1 Tax=Petaurus breviceps papuanus TaxID=3040969 RepID=UPI0036DCFAAD
MKSKNMVSPAYQAGTKWTNCTWGVGGTLTVLEGEWNKGEEKDTNRRKTKGVGRNKITSLRSLARTPGTRLDDVFLFEFWSMLYTPDRTAVRGRRNQLECNAQVIVDGVSVWQLLPMASNDKQDYLIGHNQLPCLYDTSMWGSILASVKEQLPSFDSDSSSSDEEDGELFIFQRDEENLIPDLTEELADDPDIQQLLESMINTGKKWYEGIKDSTILKGKDASKPLLICPPFAHTEEIQTDIHFEITEESTKWHKGDTWDLFRSSAQAVIMGPQVEEFPTSTYKKILTTDNLGIVNSSSSEESDSTSIKAMRKERRRMIEKDILRKEIKESPLENLNRSQFTEPKAHESTESEDIEEKMPAKYEGFKLRSLEILEELDLDDILQNLEAQKGQGEYATGATYWEVDPSFKSRESLVSNSQDRIMEQLVALCAKQSKDLSLPRKKPSDKLCHPMEDQVRSRSSGCMSCLTPGQSQDVAKDRKLKGITEPPTVFIDLRQPEPRKSVPLPRSEHRFQKQEDKLSSSDSSAESEEETPDVREEKGSRERISQDPRDQTGKSYLLQQLRAFQKTSQSCGTKTKVITQEGHSTQDAEAFEDMATSAIRRKQQAVTRETHQNTSARLQGSKCFSFPDQEAKSRGENQKGIDKNPDSEKFIVKMATPLNKTRENSR